VVVYPWVRDFISSTITLRCLHSPLQTLVKRAHWWSCHKGWWRWSLIFRTRPSA